MFLSSSQLLVDYYIDLCIIYRLTISMHLAESEDDWRWVAGNMALRADLCWGELMGCWRWVVIYFV